jgi:hypothetical protein
VGGPRLAALMRARSGPARELLLRKALVDEAGLRDLLGPETPAILAALDLPRAPSPAHVLALLDEAASGAAGDLAAWPRFTTGHVPGSAEYHGLRLFAARERDGDRWGVLLERLTGAGHHLRLIRHTIGPHLGRPPTEENKLPIEAQLDDAGPPPPESEPQLTEAPDYWTKVDRVPAFVHALRTAVAAAPRRFYSDPAQALALLGLPPDAVVIADTDEFMHATGPDLLDGQERRSWHILPSSSEGYRSLAEAISARDPARFSPGEPNVAWRLHAIFAVS